MHRLRPLRFHSLPVVSTLLALGLGAALPATAQTVVEISAPAKDNTIFSEGALSNGAGNHLFTGRTAQGALRRALVSFDLSAQIPAGAQIQAVTLRLQMNKTRFGGGSTVAAHRLLRDWGEAGSDASGQEGTGANAQAGDATWQRAFQGGEAWTTPGGDYQPAPSASTSGSGNSFTWSSAQMVADVQAWVDDPAANFGWILIGQESASSARRFTSGENPTVANRPSLSITYLEPAPTYRETWIELHFGAGANPDLSLDSDGDGLTDLEEYAHGFDPQADNGAMMGRRGVLPADSTGHLGYIFRRDPRVDDVIYRVEASDELAVWNTIAESTGGNPTAGEATVVETLLPNADPVLRVTVTDAAVASEAAPRFLRLRLIDTATDEN